MKAITIWQPWASLIALEHKRFETRSWTTIYRGPIAIHAGKSTEGIHLAVQREPFRSLLEEAGLVTELGAKLPLGCIVAIAQLTEVYSIVAGSYYLSKLEQEGAQYELAFGNFSPDRFAWKLENVQRLEQPIPARGMPGLWDWEPPMELHR